MIPIGQRVSVIEKTTESIKKNGYLRQINDHYYTIQSQRGYTKIYPRNLYELKILEKAKHRDKNYQKFKMLLSVLDN